MKRKNIVDEIRNVALIAVTAFLCILISGCRKPKSSSLPVSSSPYVQDLTIEAQNYADSLLSELTLEQRVGQCLMPSLPSSSDSVTLQMLRTYIEDYHVGGVLLFSGNLKSVEAISKIGKISPVPLFIAIDAEWGLGMRLEDAPSYPKNGDISRTATESHLYDYGRKIAEECRDIGINMVMGPVIDVVSSQGGIIGKRSYGADASFVAKYGVAYAKGLESGGVVSVAKHFPGHGSIRGDSHKNKVRINRNIEELDSIDLMPFREYINSGLSGIMAGHIQSRALDPDMKIASVSVDMLSSLLREEMGFKGLIITDAFNMEGVKGFDAFQSLEAGADIILCPNDIKSVFQDIISKVTSGALPLSIVDERCRRILFMKYLFSIPPKK